MKLSQPKEYIAILGIISGLLLFPAIQGLSTLFLREGLLTFWISKSLNIGVVKAVQPVEAQVPKPDPTRPYAVMIDNNPRAQPQSGISEADYVWEALVEGGITRLMAIFKNGVTKEIGPVRSARPYYLDWAREYDAVYAHVGGSDEALQMLRSGKTGLDDADQFRYGSSFWRDNSRRAPHNVYTSPEKMKKLMMVQEWPELTDKLDPSIRSDVFPGGDEATKISVTPSRASRTSVFKWSSETGSFDRWLGGKPANQRDSSKVSPKNIIVMELNAFPGRDPFKKGLLVMDTVGQGKATIFRNRTAIRGTWKKTSKNDQTQFYLEDGKKIAFDRGQVWIIVIAKNLGGGLVFE